MEQRALKRLKARKDAARETNLAWATRVAPCAAQILGRHFAFARRNVPEAVQETQQTELGFSAVILSLLHSGQEYTDDLIDRLLETMGSEEAERHIRILQSIGESLQSDEGVDDAVEAEFMRLYNGAPELS